MGDPTMESWHSYPSVFALGHKAMADLFKDPVLVEEKLDGSQFSFGMFESGLRVRSRGAQLNLVAPERMFERAIAEVQAMAADLHPGWTYRAEYLAKPKHNTLAYDRTPRKCIAVFDINDGHESYLPYDRKAAEAERLGLEVVPCLFVGMVETVEMFRALLDRTSMLGGQKIEGVVVKNYSRFGPDKKVLIGKFVSEAFKEVHGAEWKDANPSQGDVVETLVRMLRTPARWQKAAQHMAEAGKLESTPRDIGALMKEVQVDVEKECRDEVLDVLWRWAWPHLRRRVNHGLAEWYKERLLEKQFAPGPTCQSGAGPPQGPGASL